MVGLPQKMQWKEIRSILNKDGREVISQGSHFEDETTIVGVFASNSNSGQFWNTIFSIMKDIDYKKILLWGDFHAVTNPEMNRSKWTNASRYALYF